MGIFMDVAGLITVYGKDTHRTDKREFGIWMD
jgi:hypothetical protein